MQYVSMKRLMSVALVALPLLVFSPTLSARSFMAWAAEKYLKLSGSKKIFTSEKVFNKMISRLSESNREAYLFPDYQYGVPTEETSEGLLKVLRINPQENPESVVFYFHGGAYVNQPTKEHFTFLKNLVRKSGCEVRLVVYPKAPCYTADLTYSLFEQFYDRYLSEGHTSKLVFMGDSAGGGLSLGMSKYLAGEGKKGPDEIVLLSPWLDVEMTNPGIPAYEKSDPMLSAWGLVECGRMWAGKWDMKDSRISPIYGSNEGLAPITMFVGTHEIFCPDIEDYAKTLKASGHPCTLYKENKMNHVYPIYPIPEAKKAVKIIAQIVNPGI